MKHNSNKTALIAFSSTLAVLVIVTLVCTALFAGASDEAEPANSVVNNNVVYVGFDKEPTEEDISAALAEWDRRREAANAGTPNEDVTVEKQFMILTNILLLTILIVYMRQLNRQITISI